MLATQDPNIISARPDLRIQLYPGADGIYEMYDGTRFKWDKEKNILQISGCPIKRLVSINIPGTDFQIDEIQTEDNQTLPYERERIIDESTSIELNGKEKQILKIHLNFN